MSGILGLFRKKTQPKAPESKGPAANPAKKTGKNKPDSGKGKGSKAKSHHSKKRDNRPNTSRGKKDVPAWDISQFQVEPAPDKTRFHDFELPDGLMHAIQDSGFKYCTPIQAEVLGSTLAGRDAIGKAQTGTGKTAAFLISTIKQLIDIPPPETRYLGEPQGRSHCPNPRTRPADWQ